MKYSKLIAMGLALSVTSFGVPVSSVFANTMPSVPIEVWALRDVVNAVEVSPDGKHVLVHVVESKEGEYLLKIYKTEDMSKPYRTLNGKPMEIIAAQWVNDNYIFGTAWQQRRSKVKGPEDDTRDYKALSYNLEKNEFAEVEGNFGLANKLPKDPEHILISTGTAVADFTGVDPFARNRPRSYYKLNLKTGARELVLKGSEKHRTAEFDNDGNPRWSQGDDISTKEEITYYRNIGDSSWKEFQRYDQDEHKNLYRSLTNFMGLQGFDPANPNIGYVIDSRGEDKAALWEFNFQTGQYGEKLAGTDRADIMWVQWHSIPGNGKLVAARYPWAKRERVWFDEEEKALHEEFEKKIPNAHSISITSRSIDGKTMVVENNGPRDPGSYWLVKNGKMTKLGSTNPLVKPDQLSDVEFIRYPTRDGKTISGYVTKPKGPGPHPLIVMPHGGPHVNEVVSYDEWGQLLANAGYMVLQPQYRMSVGWGQELFDSAYGQHGFAMQDDKDDGAKYLVKQGLADPNRLAMFGWSYGGYAALVASQRQEQLYQCAIAGAAVADPAKWYRETSTPYAPKALDEWSQRRGGVIGVNPVAEVEKVNIPVMMVHGDVDRRVEIYHLEDFKAAMEAAGKLQPIVTVGESDKASEQSTGSTEPVASGGEASTGTPAPPSANYQPKHRFVTLKGADHFYATLMYKHQQQLYTEMLDFLKKDCGPGGL